MNLTVYDLTNTKAKPHFKDDWCISINVLEGAFYLSLQMSIALKVSAESRALIATDDSGNWYISLDGGEYGFRVRLQGQKRRNPYYKFSCRQMAVRLCDETKNVFKTAKFLVSKKPVIFDGTKYYRILTKNPLKVK